MELRDIIDKLKSNGYKVTEQRKAILQVLSSNPNNLISVENLFIKSKEIYNKTNMSTIYRNLEILERLNLVYKLITEDSIALYKLVCSNEHHHHIICKECGKTEIIEFCPINTLNKLAKDKNFNLTSHKLELYGYCVDCQASKDD
ncbi:Fur family transcriptional regulator [Paramaledivibacter caminithermalis]|jgi:Fe2+ or Zn2+ uptake regulation protein|uniref:Fur family transcriptional regulator, ferric uptake regulator n=1 Tax=Paramaledivibacter caminithermalis (strain DSM 15212 / CIP 107654 / DViRD3) TaxID=1121301 RepID=A0A1M6PMF4_PARC5|nr:Fur family transcriptional regulator [Paramaledivibacter caminithermalis]SHK09093.1 Fur family transcriptional regulator, ferric uptake regulator [Paramaledivibacter caminithermalis DSM 15212]